MVVNDTLIRSKSHHTSIILPQFSMWNQRWWKYSTTLWVYLLCRHQIGAVTVSTVGFKSATVLHCYLFLPCIHFMQNRQNSGTLFLPWTSCVKGLVCSLIQLQLHRHKPRKGAAWRETAQDLQITHQLNLRGAGQVNDTTSWHRIKLVITDITLSWGYWRP